MMITFTFARVEERGGNRSRYHQLTIRVSVTAQIEGLVTAKNLKEFRLIVIILAKVTR